MDLRAGEYGVNQRDLDRLISNLDAIDNRALPEITRLSLNDMAFAAFDATKDLMRERFDNPTRWTLNAFFVRKATTTRPVATVERKRPASGRHYLEVQQSGGPRPQTGIERLLSRRLKYSGLINAVLPTRNTRTNRYGNIAPGTMNRMLSAVQAQADRAQNTTAASRRRNPRRAGYFVPRDGSSLSPGIYERRGKTIRKMLAFSEAVPTYTPNFPMEERAEKVAAQTAAPAVERAIARVIRDMT